MGVCFFLILSNQATRQVAILQNCSAAACLGVVLLLHRAGTQYCILSLHLKLLVVSTFSRYLDFVKHLDMIYIDTL